jgi:glycosyltransferase involved in cell wall biosynthesis
VKVDGSSASRKYLKPMARFLYERLPLAPSRRKALKDGVYRVMAPLIKNTQSYRYWQIERRDQATDAALRSRGGERQVALLPQHFDEIFEASSQRSAYYRPIRELPVTTSGLNVIAFYLPQFHAFPENDEWWGRGFTEWTNVSKSVPQFAGHLQPRLPGELGFYDLRVKDVLRRQQQLARLYGIHGFCFHHYWFAGKRLMEAPFNHVLADPSMELPFCLCWANENWTRRWDGAEHDVLISQEHSPEDDLAFIADILPALRDSRYIRIDGAALLIVYRVALLPDPHATAQRWRDYCRQQGVGEIHLIAAQTFGIRDPRDYGFDAAVEFPPHHIEPEEISSDQLVFNALFRGRIFRYADVVRHQRDAVAPDYKLYRCAFPSWDNSARKPGRGHVFHASSPAWFGEWLRNIAEGSRAESSVNAPMIFVNAWNEWGEGAHLEPDRRHGYAYLEALGDVLADHRLQNESPLVSVIIPLYNHARYIGDALASVFAQSYTNIEVIVVDDGSTDDSVAAVRRYGERNPNHPIEIVRKENGGSHTAIAKGVAHANGEFIAFLNSDDCYASSRIGTLLECMLHDGLELTFSGVDFIDEEGRPSAESEHEVVMSLREKLNASLEYPALVYACLDSNVAVSTGNFMLRRRLYDRLGGLAALKLCHDWDFLLRALAIAKVGCVAERLYSYRLHGANTFEQLRDDAISETDVVLGNFFQSLDLEQLQVLFEDRRYFRRFVRQHGYERFLPRNGSLARAWLMQDDEPA